MDFQAILAFAFSNSASDVHLQSGACPVVRIAGVPRFVDGPPLTEEQVRAYVRSILPERMRADMDAGLVHGLDFSYDADGLGRMRCSAYSHLGQAGVVLRLIRQSVPSIEALNLPKVLRDIALSERGLTLVTGTTGSGKSTTLAALIDLINENARCKIITIEDPVEFVHVNKKSLVSQLEVGADTPSFAQALRQALRQDPDVILVGELRDAETLRIALQAADTGHQVFSTVHSAAAAQTVERIIAMFPPAEHDLLLSQLATSIEAVVSQRFARAADGSRRPAVEILRGTPVTEKFILEKKLAAMNQYMANGEAGMQTFDQHLLALYRDKIISGPEALRTASNPEALAMAIRGIRRIGGVERP